MAIIINGTGSISGLSAGGLPDNSITSDDIATNAVTEAKLATGLYTCKAWVNFNGTGTVAIRASGNVSSITDNGTGDYTVNFTTAMPDANYSYNVSAGNPSDVPRICLNATGGVQTEVTPSTTACRFFINNSGNTAQLDCKYVQVAVFR